MIADFILEKMSSYVVGGMKPKAAAHFTRDELLAIYHRQHHGRDKSGAWQITPLPENITAPAATSKCDAALNEILKTCAEMEKADIQGTAPDRKTYNNGLEGLRTFAKREWRQ